MPHSAGIVIDAVRIIRLALNDGVAGQLDRPSSYLMKSPHSQRLDPEARELKEAFIRSTPARPPASGRSGSLRTRRRPRSSDRVVR